MAEMKLSVLDCESKLAFRRRTIDGWVPGLPKRQTTSTYSEYGGGGKALHTLHTGIDEIKKSFSKRGDNQSYIVTSAFVQQKAKDLIRQFGPAFWPRNQDEAPSFIDATYGLDFSDLDHRLKYVALSSAYARQSKLTSLALRICSSN